MMKSKVKKLAMQMLSYSAVFSAVLIVNHFCPLFSYQDKEPASVRSLRKF